MAVVSVDSRAYLENITKYIFRAGLIAIAIGLISAISEIEWGSSDASSGNKNHASAPQPLIFTLVVGERTPTVTAGPGKNFVVISNKPYRVVSVQKDSTEKIHDIPAGQTKWIGREPKGIVKLIGVEKNTVIKIYPAN